MNILFLCHDFPTYTNPPTIKAFNFMKNLSKHGHNIVLVSFKEGKYDDRYIEQGLIERYCTLIRVVKIPKSLNKRWKRAIYTVKNTLLLPFTGNANSVHFMNFYFSPKMSETLDHIIKEEKIDIIIVDLFPMAGYVLNLRIPKILIEIQAESAAYYKEYKSTPYYDPIKKFSLLFEYFRIKNIESKLNTFDLCIAVTDYEKKILKSMHPKLNVCVLPYGVDTEYFKPRYVYEESNSILFYGNLKTNVNRTAIKFFLFKIFPLIKKEIPDVKLNIVGSDPQEDIKRLGYDNNISIVGYVRDIRSYIERSACVILPMIKAIGIKTRLLEAMAMGKPVVTTSIATRGINVSPGKNVIIANDVKEFARCVVELLNDKGKRDKMGKNARKFIEERYSWGIISENFYNILLKTINC